MKILAIIPARSGSKGLKDKNIKPLCGLPLCAYTINAAKESGIFDEIHFSTDSEQYAEIAKQYGASVPFLRDASLATDTASTWDVIKAVIARYKENGKSFDAVMLLQPTTPFRDSRDIRNAYELLCEKNAQAIVSVTEPAHSPVLCAELPEDGNMEVYHHKMKNLIARQQLKPQVTLNGAIYFFRVEHLLTRSDIYECGCYAYHMPRERSYDIDSPLDFKQAEFVLQEQLKGK